MLYFKLNVTNQGSNVLHIDIHLLEYWMQSYLKKVGWVPKKVAQFYVIQRARVVYLTVSFSPSIYFYLAHVL